MRKNISFSYMYVDCFFFLTRSWTCGYALPQRTKCAIILFIMLLINKSVNRARCRRGAFMCPKTSSYNKKWSVDLCYYAIIIIIGYAYVRPTRRDGHVCVVGAACAITSPQLYADNFYKKMFVLWYYRKCELHCWIWLVYENKKMYIRWLKSYRARIGRTNIWKYYN